MEITGSNGFIGSYLTKNFDLDSNAVIHLAGRFSNDLDVLIRDNLYTTKTAVEKTKALNARLIFTSTGGVYGTANRPWKETDTPAPDTLYGLSKLYAEEYIKFSGVNFVILRFPNVYGPGNKKGVIHNFLTEIKEKGTLTIMGDGEQKRDFLHVHDACTAIKAASENGLTGIFNVSNENYSLNEVVEMLQKLVKKDFEVIYKPSDENNKLMNLSLDISKIKSALSWEPEISLEEGLEELVAEVL